MPPEVCSGTGGGRVRMLAAEVCEGPLAVIAVVIADLGAMLSRFRRAFSKFYGALLVSTLVSVSTSSSGGAMFSSSSFTDGPHLEAKLASQVISFSKSRMPLVTFSPHFVTFHLI